MKFFKKISVVKYKAIGESFRKWRKKKDMGVVETAKLFGISQTYLTQMENNKTPYVSEKIVNRINEIIQGE